MIVAFAFGLVDGSIGDDAIRGQEHSRDGRRVLQGRPVDLRRSEDAVGDEIAVGPGECVETEVAFAITDLGNDDRTLLAGVVGDGLQGNDHRCDDGLDAVAGVSGHAGPLGLERGKRTKEAHAASGDDAFLDRCTRRMQCILDTSLLLLEFGFARSTDVDLGHAAGELRQSLLELLAIVVGVARGDLVANQGDALLDVRGGTRSFDDGAFIRGDDDLLGATQLGDADLLEVDAEVLHDGLATGEDRDVAEHGLAAVAVARGLHGTDLGDPAELVDDEGGKGFARDILGDDQQRLLGLDDLLEDRNDLLDRIDLVLVDEHVGLVELDAHRLGVGDEVRTQVSPIELHPLDDFDVRLQALALFDGDHAVLADLLEGFGHDAADLGIVVGGDRGHGLDLVLDRTRQRGDAVDDRVDAFPHAAYERVGIDAGADVLQAAAKDRFGEHRGGRGSVASLVAGLGCRFTHKPCAHVLDGVPQLDFLGDGDAVLGDGGSTPTLVEHRIAASRSES